METFETILFDNKTELEEAHELLEFNTHMKISGVIYVISRAEYNVFLSDRESLTYCELRRLVLDDNIRTQHLRFNNWPEYDAALVVARKSEDVFGKIILS